MTAILNPSTLVLGPLDPRGNPFNLGALHLEAKTVNFKPFGKEEELGFRV